MAIDEALFDSVAVPSIRFYRWNSPALSFGYFGKFADVANYASERDLVRRWTGGGVVFHGEDLTYAIVIPPSDPVFSESSRSIYAAIHAALRDALVANGEPAELAPGMVDAGAAIIDRGYNLPATNFSSFTTSAANLRMPSAVFSVAIALSFRR